MKKLILLSITAMLSSCLNRVGDNNVIDSIEKNRPSVLSSYNSKKYKFTFAGSPDVTFYTDSAYKPGDTLILTLIKK